MEKPLDKEIQLGMISGDTLEPLVDELRATLALPQFEQSTKKRCGTCLHYQKAPLPGQGWCRNGELRSEHERALVSRHDYRCLEMMDDYWEPAPELEGQGSDTSLSLASFSLPGVKAHYVYAVALSIMLLASAVVLFSNSVLSTPVVSSTAKGPLAASAKSDFWLREDATSSLPSVIYVMVDSKLELIDSKAGEVLDASLPAPSKWYKLKVLSSGDIGWAYSGWIERP